jgi:hypothetical protein
MESIGKFPSLNLTNMKNSKIINSIITLVLISSQFKFAHKAKSCDVCGASSSFNGFGQIATLSNNFLLTEYRYQHYIQPNTGGNKSWDVVQSIDVEYGWRWDSIPRLLNTLQMPLKSVNRFQVYDAPFQKISLGDIQWKSIYTLYDNRNYTFSDQWKHLVFANAAVKLPTGKYQTLGAEKELLPIHLQPGTGSWQFDLGATYLSKINNWAFLTTVNTQFSTQNELSYRFGNRQNLAAALMYAVKNQKSIYYPQLGIQFDHWQKDNESHQTLTETGGKQWQYWFQIDWFKSKSYMRFKISKPFHQQYDEDAPKLEITSSLSWAWLF